MSVTNRNPREGSVIIAALIIAIVTATLVGYYLRTVTQEVNYSHRARMSLQAVNLAEAGIEYALASIQNGDWSAWEKGDDGLYRDYFPYVSYTLHRERRSVRVYVEPNATPPSLVAEGIIQHNSGIEVRKQVYVELGNRSLFANGLLSKNGVTFSGNKVWIDSYISSLGPYDPHLNSNDNGSVASISVKVGAIDVNNADIYGRVATGGAWPEVGPNGSIFGEDTPSGTKIDPARVATDFYAELPDPTAPTLSSPESTHGSVIGAAKTHTEYHLSSLQVKNKDTVTITGDVTMIVDGDIDIKGELRIAPEASLELYVEGDLIAGGNGIVNVDGMPPNLLVYGTGKDTEFKLHGSAAFAGAVYAPNSDVSLKGGGNSGELFGAAVGKDIVIVGNYAFHDEVDIADLDAEAAAHGAKWAELTAAEDRRNMDSILDDGL